VSKESQVGQRRRPNKKPVGLHFPAHKQGLIIMNGNPRLIRKYANRRLYDTVQSRYVNLHDVRNLIVAGKYIKVEDQATKTDITNSILLQIIAMHEPEAGPLLTSDILTDLIRNSATNQDPMLKTRLQQACRGALSNQQH
jgi:polyhydroxyalkanoate synthesis repressor PhaR